MGLSYDKMDIQSGLLPEDIDFIIYYSGFYSELAIEPGTDG